ncbi:hypothetical protein ACKVMT_05075 [Halobacteriales archaeon Cl-PHB]
MVNTPIDRSPGPSDGSDPSADAPPDDARSGSSTPVRLLRRLRSVVRDRLDGVRRWFAGDRSLETAGGHGRRGAAHSEAATRVDIRGVPAAISGSERGDAGQQSADSRSVTALATTDVARSDPPEHPESLRLDVERRGDRLSLSQPGNPDAYVSSTEWVTLEE